jgi:hypothetical protein
MKRGWIGVDLDGTLAKYDHWRGPHHIGEPIAPMVQRVQHWLSEGRDVRIFTARVDGGDVAAEEGHPDAGIMHEVEQVKHYIEAWCVEHIGQKLPITNRKDYGMIELWDDRAIQVEFNTGRRMDGHPEAPVTP